MNKNYYAQALDILRKLLRSELVLSRYEIRVIPYQFLFLFGGCHREIFDILLRFSDSAFKKYLPSFGIKKFTDRTVDDFLSRNVQKGELIRIPSKNKSFYKLSDIGKEYLLAVLKRYPSISKDYLTWAGTINTEQKISATLHSANVGLIILQILHRSDSTFYSFGLNTSFNSTGTIITGTNERNSIYFVADGHLFISSPFPYHIFLENDMGTERREKIIDKMERYFSLSYSDKYPLHSSSVHFTLGTYNTATSSLELAFPSRTSLQLYKGCLSSFLSMALWNGMPTSLSPSIILPIMNDVKNVLATENNLFEPFCSMTEYFNRCYELMPDINDISLYLHSCTFSDRQLPAPVYGIDRTRHSSSYVNRREKLFEWFRLVENVDILLSKGFRITTSDNCYYGADFFASYPSFFYKTDNVYYHMMQEYIDALEYTGKYALDYPDIYINSSLEHFKYKNMQSFRTDYDNYYLLANCFFVEHLKGNFIFAFENVSDDFSARIRIEKYLDIYEPSSKIIVCIIYADDIGSIKYIHSLQEQYHEILENSNTILFKMIRDME